MKVYHIDLYEVKIGARIGQITVQYFDKSNLFFCKFLNDDVGDFINTYESFGFYVDLSDQFPKFTVNGNFTQTEAMSVWEQIERAGKPIGTTFLTLRI